MTHSSLHEPQRSAPRSNSSHSLRYLRFLLFNLRFTKQFGTEGNEVNEGRQSMKVICFPIVLLLAISGTEAIAGPRVDIVIGEKAPVLEKLAADELARQLKRLYEADVKIGSTAPAKAEHVLFVGSPDTNASMKPFADAWPSGDKKLTDQGHLLRSVSYNKRPALLIGGGSPVATYWAVAEFGHRLGIRSMLFGDLDPVSPPAFTLDGHDVVIEPSPRHRGWHFENFFHTDSASWGTDEFRSVIQQLAKLRFNHVTIGIHTGQPFAHIEYAGIAQSTSHFAGQTPIAVSGDTLGRKAFGGAKVFENPSFIGADNYAKRRAAGEKHLREIISAAQAFGMRVSLAISVRGFPAEFAKLWPDLAAKLKPNEATVWPMPLIATDEHFAGMMQAWVRAVIETYPTLDGLELWDSTRSDDDADALRKFLSRPGLLKRPDGRDLPVKICELDDMRRGTIVEFVGRSPVTKPIMQVQLNDIFSALPSFRPDVWEKSWNRAAPQGGFDIVMLSGFGEYDLPTYWLSRQSCGNSLSPQQACHELLTPVCGEEVDHRVWKAVELAQSAISALTERDAELSSPKIESIIGKAEPPPAAWNTARDGFLNAMNEMYRANTRAREGGRAYTLYLARRFEFAFEYLNYAEAVRKSAIAERANDRETQIAEIEKAIESLNNALNAMAAVARSNSDRGLIAVLNEYGYRPLKKKLADAEEAAK